MLALALLLIGCAALQTQALPALVQYQSKDELGQYSYGYSGGPSAKHEERTFDGVTRGSYSYIDGNGLVQTRSYEADDVNGFRVVGTDINAPTGVASRPVTTINTALPVSHRTPFVKTYQPVSYVNRGYDTIDSFSGNEVSFAPVAESYSTPLQFRKTVTTSVPTTPYAPALEYVKGPYVNKLAWHPVAYSPKYVRPYTLSTNSLDVSPLSSIGIRYPTASYSQIQPIAYHDSLEAIQSTVTPPTVQTVYSSGIPVTATVATPVQTVSIPTRTYQTASSQLVNSYVPKEAFAYTHPASIALTNTAPVTVTSGRPSVIGITNTFPAPIAYTESAGAPIAYTGVSAGAFPYTKTVPSDVAYTDASSSSVTYTSPTALTYTDAVPAVAYGSSAPSIAYGYYPTPSFTRYANAAPAVQATVYTPYGGYTAANPVPLQQAIATQYHAQDELGQYRYGYSNVNSAKEESKTIDGVTRGSFSYVDANGVLQSRSYVSDDVNGFRVIGTDIPKGPDGQVNPDAIPSEHVNVVPAQAAPVAVHAQHILGSAAPAQLVSQSAVELDAPVFVSSTPAPFLY